MITRAAKLRRGQAGDGGAAARGGCGEADAVLSGGDAVGGGGGDDVGGGGGEDLAAPGGDARGLALSKELADVFERAVLPRLVGPGIYVSRCVS